MNVFSSLLSNSSMVNITAGQACAAKGDYLSWDQMEWKTFGQVTEGSVSMEDLCQMESKSSILLPTTFQTWQQCMDFCPKLRRARALSIQSKAETEALVKWAFNTVRDSVTLEYYPDVQSGPFWIPFNDTESEGSWVDYYTNAPANAVEAQSFAVNGGTTENCDLFPVPASYPRRCTCS